MTHSLKIKLLLLLTISPLVSGCETLNAKRGVNEENKASIRKIAVASQLGDYFQNSHMGTTVFSNQESQVKVQWGMDAFAQNIAMEELHKTGKYQVVAIDAPPSTDGSKALPMAAQAGADTLISITPSAFGALAPGYGLIDKNTFGFSAGCVYSIFIVHAYDVKNAKEIGWQYGFDTVWKGACRFDENIKYKPRFASYTPQEQQSFQAIIKQRTSEGVKQALKDLELTQ